MPVTGDTAALSRQVALLRTLTTEGAKRISRQVAEEAKHLISEGFQAGKSPDGVPWAPLKSRKGQPLRDTGRLANSIVTHDTGNGFVAGTNVVYASVHQLGASYGPRTQVNAHGDDGKFLSKKAAGKKSKTESKVSVRISISRMHGHTLPARPFLPQGDRLPGPWEQDIEAIVDDALTRFFGK